MWHLLSASHRGVHPAALRQTSTDSGKGSAVTAELLGTAPVWDWTPGLEQHSKWHFARRTPQNIVLLVKNRASREFYHHLFSRVPVLKGRVCFPTGQVPECALPAWWWELLGTPLSGAGGLWESQGRLWKGPIEQNPSLCCTQVSFHVHLCLFSDKAGTVHYLHVLGCLL